MSDQGFFADLIQAAETLAVCGEAASMVPQERLIGPGSLCELGPMVERLNPERAILVTGGRAYVQSGARDCIEPALSRLELTRFSFVAPNPDLATIERGVSICRARRPSVIVAVGGGSVIDVAKLMSLLGSGTARLSAWCERGGIPDKDPVPVIAIPTTAGSGAEATRFATFYDCGVKRSLSHPLLRPRHVIVDALLTRSMPAALAASTGLDALAQAIESLWAVGATPDSQALAEAALLDILPCLENLLRAPTPGLRERLARGAHLAGQAIDLSRTTAAHALSYALTSDLGVPHGHAVALLLPAIFRINARPAGRLIQEPRGAAYLEAVMDRILRRLGCRDAESGAVFLQRQVAELGLATGLAVGSDGKMATMLARKVNGERLGNNPVALSMDDVVDIYAQLQRDAYAFEAGSPRSRQAVAAT